ncbi:MAG: hypothetical protein CMP40_02395 [Rickettsiales bacterium]|nr:hypothetical protein [Rickettsiales bacterium]
MANNVTKIISCDGTENTNSNKNEYFSKHPLVYFKISNTKKTESPYCEKIFNNSISKNY